MCLCSQLLNSSNFIKREKKKKKTVFGKTRIENLKAMPETTKRALTLETIYNV